MVSSYRFCCKALLSVTYNDMLASCDGVNVFGRRCNFDPKIGARSRLAACCDNTGLRGTLQQDLGRFTLRLIWDVMHALTLARVFQIKDPWSGLRCEITSLYAAVCYVPFGTYYSLVTARFTGSDP